MSDPACPFCDFPDPLLENELAFVKPDKYPVSEGHLLIIPKRHAIDWFDLRESAFVARIRDTVEAAQPLTTKGRQPAST